MPTKQEILEDFKIVMEDLIEWHDEISCLFRLDDAVRFAKKYGMKIDTSSLNLHGDDYSLKPETLKFLKKLRKELEAGK